MQARGQRIQAAKPCRHAGYDQVTMLNGFRFFQHAFGRMLDVFESLANALVGQSKDCLFRMIENVLRLVFFFQSFGRDLLGSFYELTK